jgi:hypothetical protein
MSDPWEGASRQRPPKGTTFTVELRAPGRHIGEWSEVFELLEKDNRVKLIHSKGFAIVPHLDDLEMMVTLAARTPDEQGR